MNPKKKKKPKLLLLKNSGRIAPGLLIISLIFVYFTPREITYADSSVMRAIPFLFIFFIIPYLVFKTSVLFSNRTNLVLILTGAAPIIVGPTCGLFQGYREEIELKKYGVWTTSIVVDRKYSKKRNTPGEWLIKCSYKANNQSYETYYHKDNNEVYPIGGKIKIIYSSEYPKIYALDYNWKK